MYFADTNDYMVSYPSLQIPYYGYTTSYAGLVKLVDAQDSAFCEGNIVPS